MPWNWNWATWILALLLTTIPAASAQAADPSERLLPDTTKGFISVTDVQLLADQWRQTRFGQLLEDPMMEPFVDDLLEQFAERQAGFQEKIGLTLDDLRGIAGGELSAAIIQPAKDQMAVLLMVDVTGNLDQANALLVKVSDKLLEEGAKKTTHTRLEPSLVVFDLPKKKDEQTGEPVENAPQQQAIYFLKNDLLVASDSFEEIRGVLSRLADARDKVLADVPAFQAVMRRCQEDAGEAAPQIRWFIDPFGYAEAIRAALPKEDRPKRKTMQDHLRATGFTAAQAIGGFLDFKVESYEMVHRTAIYAPKPFEKSMRMLEFQNVREWFTPPWVPRNVVSYSTINIDLLKAFDNVGPIFDEVVGEGEEGIWEEDVLPSMETALDGPQINLRKELFSYLDDQVIAITDYKLPIETTSERLLFAVKTTDAKKVKEAVEKILKDDLGEDVRQVLYEDHLIWEAIPKLELDVEAIRLDVPPLGTDLGGPGEVEEGDDIDKDEDKYKAKSAPILPEVALTVAHGYLLVASHREFLIKVLKPVDERETLSRSIDFLQIDDAITQAGGGEACIRVFSRTDEAYRPTYELIRQGKMPESQTMLGRVLNMLFGAGKSGEVRQQKIDGSKMPDFEAVRHHLGSAGMFTTAEENGWFIKGFSLGKE